MNNPTSPFRRIVTGENVEGKSAVVENETLPLRLIDPIRERLEDSTWGADVWTVAHDPTSVFVRHVPDTWQVEPPPAGAVFRVISFAPHSTIDLHTTRTMDLGVVMSGEVWLTLEEDEVLLRPTDCVVVTGSQHGWENRSSEPCLMAAILMSTSPSHNAQT